MTDPGTPSAGPRPFAPPLARRDFLRMSALAAGGAALGVPFLPRDYLRPALTARRPGAGSRRVAVLGAGLAGLSAAWELVRAGHDVTVLEARSRAGGRVHTLREPFADGLYAEAGAMFAGGPHLMRFAEELGIDFVPPRFDGAFLFHLRGERIPIREDGPERPWPVKLTPEERELGMRGMWRRYVLEAASEIGDPVAESWPPGRLRKYDDLSFTEFLRERGASPGAVELLRLRTLDLNGEGFETLSALSFLRDFAARRLHPSSGGGVVDGGTDRIPEAFASRLADRIRYGTEVVRIEQDGAGVRVHCRSGGQNGTVEADRAVCTFPFPVVRGISFSPALPDDKRRAITSLPYSSITRVYLQVRRRFWEDEGLSGAAWTDLPVPRVLVHPMARATSRAVLEAHTGKRSGARLSAMDEEERIAFALEQLETIHPGVRDHTEGGTSYAWLEDPWARGGYSAYAPGQIFEFLDVVGRPEGRIHFAGEHTSRLSTSMDGALESGVRAAREIDGAARRAGG